MAEQLSQTQAQDWPTVSVIVPVFNDERTVGQTVRAILSQDYPAGRFEAIFIDNGSTDRSREILERYRSRIVILSESKRGPGPARNTGIQWARHEYLAFTDADGVPEPGWLRALVLCAQRHSQADFIGGKVVPLEPACRVAKFAGSIHDQEAAIRIYHPPYAITGNLLMPRLSLLKIGLFDESLRRAGDVDLSYRGFFQHDSRFAFAEEAVVGHANPNNFFRLFRKGVQHGQGAASILAKYSRELQETPWQRCMKPRPYLSILHDCVRALGCGFEWSSDKDRSKDQEVVNFLGKAVFNSGKQLGLWLGTLRRRR